MMFAYRFTKCKLLLTRRQQWRNRGLRALLKGSSTAVNEGRGSITHLLRSAMFSLYAGAGIWTEDTSSRAL